MNRQDGVKRGAFSRRGLLLLALLAGAILCSKESEAGMDSMQTYALSNGMQVIAKQVHAVPIVSVFVWYRVGAQDEPAGQSGLAHFLEHMLFKGTPRFPKGEISRLVARTGGNQNAFTSNDYTAYYETLPSEHLELALQIEADRMQHALLDPGETEKERTVILSELDGNRNHPQVRLRDLVLAQTWLTHPYRRPIIGWREEVEKLTAEQLRAFYRMYYQPGNACLVVVGDFQPDQLKNLVEKNFGVFPSGPKIVRPVFPAETQSGQRRAVLKDHGSSALVQLVLPIPPAGHPDQYALTVLNDALTRGKTSRLYKALVETSLATEISGSPHEMRDNGIWEFFAVCQRGVDPKRVEAAMLAEFEKVKRLPLDPKEFARSVTQTRAQLIYSRESLTEQATIYGFYQTVAGDWKLPDLYPEKVAGVTADQVRRAAEKYLNPDHFTVGNFLPLDGEQAGPAAALPAEGVLRVRSAGPLLEAQQNLPPAPGGTQAGGAASQSSAQRFVLSNGLTLLVQSNFSNPTLSVSGLVRGGIASEPVQTPGLCWMHAALLDRGTKKRNAAQLADDLENRAARLSYAAGPEELNFSGEALSEDAGVLLAALAETLSEPVFPAEEVEKVRKELLTDCRMAQDNVSSQAWKGFFGLAYPVGHPLRRNLMDSESGLAKLQRAELAAYHAAWIRPDSTVISIAGAVTPEGMRELAEKLFGSWRAAGQPGRAEVADMQPVRAVRDVKKIMPGKHESIVILGHEGIHRLDPEYYPAYVANHVLGGSGLSSQLMRTVRDEEGLTYGIYSQFRLMHSMRPWCVIFQADPGKVERAVAATLEQVRLLQSGKLAEPILDDAREQLVGGLVMSLETNAGLAHLNREIEYHQLGKNYLQDYARAVRGVDSSRMVKAAERWFHPDAYLLSVAGPGGDGKK